MWSGSLHVHEPRYKTQNYGSNDHRTACLEVMISPSPLQKKAPTTHARG